MSLNNNLSNHKQQKGFGLLEVLISTVVFSLGLLSLVGLQLRNVNISTVAYTNTQSTLYLQEIVTLLRINKESAIKGTYNMSESSFSDMSATANPDFYRWFKNLHNTIPSVKVSINCQPNNECLLNLKFEVSKTIEDQSLAIIL